ncbi:nucleoside 2-deoxyribosyltransferase [Candidatus Magnetomorum sp. HK-1]|nr:nucleoside 2-deoxyribosyltransferase [Candidatus Magnetomorum sp. HK-1]
MHLKRVYKKSMNNSKHCIYCSGPLFSPEEQVGMNAISQVIEQAGYSVFLPQRDGLEAYVLKYINTPLNTRLFYIRDQIDQAIFALDVFQIVQRCHAILVNLNGRVPDEGAIVEASIAFSCNKPVIFYKNDCRAPFSGRDNAMILGLSNVKMVKDLDDIPVRLKKVLSRISLKSSKITQAGPLMSAIKHGERIWTLMKPFQSAKQKTTEQMDAMVNEVLAICKSFTQDIDEK